MARSVEHGNPSTASAAGTVEGGGSSLVPPRSDGPLVDELVLHDLMGPLSGAVGHLQILQMQLSDPKCRSKADTAYAALCELSEMIGTLQYLMHLERGAFGEPKQSLGVREVLDEVREAVQPAAEIDQPAVEVREVPAGMSVSGYPQLLRQALCGLTRVGLRLCRQGAVSLGAEPTEADGVRLTVTYGGRTLPEELIEKLFDEDLERIQRDHSLRIDRAHGLMLVAAAARAHGGAVGYEPVADGGRFWFELPGASASSGE